jgi:hypothetical protein
VPASITLSNGASAIEVATSNTAVGPQVLSGAIGGAGGYSFFVGGQFTITSATTPGAYSGAYVVTVSYD